MIVHLGCVEGPNLEAYDNIFNVVKNATLRDATLKLIIVVSSQLLQTQEDMTSSTAYNELGTVS